MHLRTVVKFLLLFYSIINYSCSKNKCILESKIIRIEYDMASQFKDKYIRIDGIQFSHTFSMDSIRNGNFLPAEKLIVLEVESKKAIRKITPIDLGFHLSKKINKTKKYIITNPHELRVSGILEFKRKDGRQISIETSVGYPGKINNKVCNK